MILKFPLEKGSSFIPRQRDSGGCSLQIVEKTMDTPLNFTTLTLRVQKMSPLLGETLILNN